MARTDYHKRRVPGVVRAYVKGKKRIIRRLGVSRRGPGKSQFSAANTIHVQPTGVSGGSVKNPSVAQRLSRAMSYLGKGPVRAAPRFPGRIGMVQRPIRGGCLNIM